MSLKVIIVGYGKMGQEIERALGQRSHHVVARVDPYRKMESPSILPTLNDAPLNTSDVVIDFSTGSSVASNLASYCAHSIPSVIGTTGWNIPTTQLRNTIQKADTSCIIGTNFSIGAHLFFRLLANASKMIARFPQYDIMLHEVHHAHKIDSPSGTARTAAQHILMNHPVKKKMCTEPLQRPIHPEELHISSLRGGTIHGIHKAIIDAPQDTIEISHSARNRSGFAHGAVMAAEWIVSRRGLYTMDEYIDMIMEKE